MAAKKGVTSCPCGSGKFLADCCGLFLDGRQQPATAEALMRSRYTAYVLGNEHYLFGTWHNSNRPASLRFDEAPLPKWIDLKVLHHAQTDDSHAIVEFVARYKINGRAFKLQETSRFVKEDGRWFYVDGDIKDSAA